MRCPSENNLSHSVDVLYARFVGIFPTKDSWKKIVRRAVKSSHVISLYQHLYGNYHQLPTKSVCVNLLPKVQTCIANIIKFGISVCCVITHSGVSSVTAYLRVQLLSIVKINGGA